MHDVREPMPAAYRVARAQRLRALKYVGPVDRDHLQHLRRKIALEETQHHLPLRSGKAVRAIMSVQPRLHA
jgi:hypothetical protein